MPRGLRHGRDVLVKVPVLWQVSHLEEVGEQGKRTGEKLRKQGNTNHGENKGRYPWKLSSYTEGQGPPSAGTEIDKVTAG